MKTKNKAAKTKIKLNYDYNQIPLTVKRELYEQWGIRGKDKEGLFKDLVKDKDGVFGKLVYLAWLCANNYAIVDDSLHKVIVSPNIPFDHEFYEDLGVMMGSLYKIYYSYSLHKVIHLLKESKN